MFSKCCHFDQYLVFCNCFQKLTITDKCKFYSARVLEGYVCHDQRQNVFSCQFVKMFSKINVFFVKIHVFPEKVRSKSLLYQENIKIFQQNRNRNRHRALQDMITVKMQKIKELKVSRKKCLG